MISYGDITKIRFEHREEIINRLLEEGWILLCEPFVGLRKAVQTNEDGQVYMVDIPWREFVLGRRREV